MTVWYHQSTIFKPRRALRIAGLLALCVALITTLFFANVSRATTGVNQTLSFQGRLTSAAGAVVPDGYYNIQFKIYQDGAGTAANNPGGTLKWTESYVNNGGTNGVEVKNGFFSVSLGSNNPFGTQVDWNQDTLWLSMNIAGSSASCTTFGTAPCTADGEMLPMKRITSVPYALQSENTNKLNGLTSSNFLQLAQGVQTDASTNTSSIFINKTGSGNLIQLQNTTTDVFTVGNTGDVTLGNNADHTLSIATSGVSTAGRSLTVAGGTGGSGTGSDGGDLILQGGSAGGTNGDGGAVVIDSGNGTGSGGAGTIYMGSSNNAGIQIGNTGLASGTQTIVIGTNNTAGGTTHVVIGSGSGSSGGTTTIQSKDNTTIKTNGIDRATFDTTGKLYVGNGTSSSSPANFTIQGTNSSSTGVTGGSLTVQGGNGTTGNANGGNLTLSGGTASGSGTNGLVVITTPTMQQVSDACVNASNDCTIATTSLNNNAAIVVGFSGSVNGKTAFLPDPANTTAGRLVYITAANGSSDFVLSVNGGGFGNQIAMRQNTTATMIWNGSDWTAAGASSSTTLQTAYDNTLQSAGGAELVVSNGSNANGLTIRDSSTSPVNGTLLEVQNSAAANLFSINSNVTEYASNAGAEGTFSASNWSALTGSTITRNTTIANVATGQASAQVATTTSAGSGVKNTLSVALTPGQHYNVSFTTKLSSGTFTDVGVYYSIDGSADSVTCTTGKAAKTTVWTKVNCTFTAPSSGITSNNSINIRQVGSGTARTFYVDNISVMIAADYNYASDGTVNNAANFGTNWTTTGAGSTVTRNTSSGQEASDSAQVVTTAGNTNIGVRNKLAISPLVNSLYRLSVYVRSSNTFNDFAIKYSRDGGTSFVDCVDYNTQSISTTDWTQVTCYIQTDGTTATDPYVRFIQTASAARTFYVDTFTMTLVSNSTPPNVQIGGGANGGPTTLLTLDKAASAPIAADNEAMLGSMYYDTTIGKLQCYEADGWGSCGSSPDNIITISPEYTNAVMHGTGVGTMTSDLCSDALDINDGTSSQPTICSSNETYNFYKWTSPQTTSQEYSIYVTYQLPGTFKAFASGSTSLYGRVSDMSNASINYQVYRSNASSGLTSCGSSVTVPTGANTWRQAIATGTADPSTCGFAAGDSIVFKITLAANSNANAYVGNLGFTFSNR